MRRAIHARLPTALAMLQTGFEIWLQFALEADAIGTGEQAMLLERNAKALRELAVLQSRYHQESDPALCFLSLLRAALASGRAHVSDRTGKKPDVPEFWGWRRKQTGSRWSAKGARIGWVIGSDLFLDPTVSYQSGPTDRGGRAPSVERADAPPSAKGARPVSQHRRRPPDAAGSPYAGGPAQTSAASES